MTVRFETYCNDATFCAVTAKLFLDQSQTLCYINFKLIDIDKQIMFCHF